MHLKNENRFSQSLDFRVWLIEKLVNYLRYYKKLRVGNNEEECGRKASVSVL